MPEADSIPSPDLQAVELCEQKQMRQRPGSQSLSIIFGNNVFAAKCFHKSFDKLVVFFPTVSSCNLDLVVHQEVNRALHLLSQGCPLRLLL
jgi:hypothetical protein